MRNRLGVVFLCLFALLLSAGMLGKALADTGLPGDLRSLEEQGLEPDMASSEGGNIESRDVILLDSLPDTEVLLVPNSTDHSVGIYDPFNGDYLGDFVVDDANLSTPICATKGPDGNIYVSDQIDDAVRVYDKQGNFVMTYADNTDGLDNVRGIAFRGDHLFVTSYALGIFEFSGPHTLVGMFITDSNSNWDIFFLEDGRSIVTNSTGTDDIRLYSATGVFEQTLFATNFPEQAQIDVDDNSSYLTIAFSSNMIYDFDLGGNISQTTALSGGRGIYRLGNGNYLATNSAGTHEVAPGGGIIRTVHTGGCRFIELYSPAGGSAHGWLRGTVTDVATTLPIEGAVVAIGYRRDTTGVDGSYMFELYPTSYSVTASALYHNSLTEDSVAVVENDTTTQNFALTAPGLQVDTAPVDTFLLVGQTATFNRNITNTGNGQLDWSVEVSFGNRLLSSGVRVDQKGAPISIDEALKSEISEYAPDFTPGQPPAVLDFGDELFTFDPQTPAGDEACLGMEFDGTYFWVTGRHPSDNVHKLHKYDRNGTYITSYDQGTSSTWGWRDMAFDGTYLYASDESEFARIDPATGLRVGTLPMPSGFTPPLRGLAYDPATDHFWAANFSSNIIEFTRTGQIINSFANAKAIYGLAWDDVTTGGPFLWTFSQDGTPPIEVNQFDPVSGAYTGVTFYAIDHSGGNDDLAGGACFTTDWNPAFGVLFVLVQGQAGGVSYDLVQGYEITPYSNWLSLNPTSGTLAPAQSATLAITIDFTGPNVVADSTYHASITVRSNAQGAPVIPVTAGARTGIEDGDTGLPASYSLSQNYPNPFNGATVISFALAKDSDVRLEVFNLLGQRVETLVSSRLPAGYHTVSWSSEEAASGVYFYRLQAGDFSEVHQMTLMK